MKCSICGSDVTYYHSAKDKTCDYTWCTKCEIAEQNPRIGYTDYTAAYYQRNNLFDLDYYKHTMDYDFYLLDQYGPKKGRALDFGCSTGPALLRLKDLGFKAVGFDISEPAVKTCTDMGLDAHTSMSEIKGTFDLIICRETIEHLADPFKEFIDPMPKRLRDGGVMYVQTPTPTNKDGPYTFSTQHLFLFPLKTTVRLFEERGLKTLFTLESDLGCTVAIFKKC